MPVEVYPEVKTKDGSLDHIQNVAFRINNLLRQRDLSLSKHAGFVSCPLAVSCRNKQLDTDPCYKTAFIAVAGVIRSLAKVSGVTFDKILSELQQHSLLQRLEDDEGRDVTSQTLVKEGNLKKFLDKNCNATEPLRMEVKTWLNSFIIDNEVKEEVKIDSDELARMLALSSAEAYSQNATSNTQDYLEQKLIDIAVLRFPSSEHPRFKLYSLSIKIWTDVLFSKQNEKHCKSGLMGQFYWLHFYPRASMIENLPDNVKNKAENEGRKFYGAKSID